MSKLHYFTALLLIILLAFASGWVFQSIENNPIKNTEKLRHDPDYFLKNFVATTMNKAGKPAYKIKAEFLEHFPDDDSMELKQPFFSFYENNRVAWTAEANAATILQQKDVIYLNGGVQLKQMINTKVKIPIYLTAEHLTIEAGKNIVRTKSKVKLVKGKNTITSTGLNANMKKNKIEFLSKTWSHYVLPAK